MVSIREIGSPTQVIRYGQVGYHSVLNVKALVGAFNQEKVLVGAFAVIVQLHRLIVFTALVPLLRSCGPGHNPANDAIMVIPATIKLN